MKHEIRVLTTLGVLLLAGILGAYGARRCGIWVNMSRSMPLGLYRAATPRVLKRGSIAVVCLPDSLARWGYERGYLPRGRCRDGIAPVGKRIFGVGGDTVIVSRQGLALAGGSALVRSVALKQDSRGRALSRMPDGRYVVPKGEMWLLSGYSDRSWDSRYYGAVPVVDAISAVVAW